MVSAALAVVGLMSSCGSGGPPGPSDIRPSSSPAVSLKPGQKGPTVIGSTTLKGAIEAKGNIEILYPAADVRLGDCMAVARGETGSYVVPLASMFEGRRVVWSVTVSPYSGPGTFDVGDLSSLTAEVLPRPDAESGAKYTKKDGTRAKLEVKPDNSGTFEFTDLAGPDGKKLSGASTWTCSK